jgi:CBS domain-containing protein
MICPSCGQANIDGVDICEHCEQPLLFEPVASPTSSVEQALLHDTVIGIATAPPVIVPPNLSVGDVLDLLVEHSIGCVIVADGDEAIGIFSERDALMRIGAQVDLLRSEPVARFMTPAPQTLEADAPIAFALHMMNVGGYRHLPVISEGRIVGVVSIRDIMQYLAVHLLAASAS